MSERRERAWVVLAVALGAASVVFALWRLGAGTGSSAFLAAMALIALPPALLVASVAGLLLLVTRCRRERHGGTRTLPLLGYVLALSWTALGCLAVLGFGLPHGYEGYCHDRAIAGLSAVTFGPELDLWPPGATCTFTLQDGSSVTRTYRTGVAIALSAWLAVTLALLVSVHVVLTRIWRWWQADPLEASR